MEADIADPVSRGVGLRPLDERRIALDGRDFGHATGKRQAEIAEAAEQVECPVPAPRLEQLERALDHEPVQHAVHLHEVRRSELDSIGDTGQGIAERTRRRAKRHDAIESLGLQVQRDPVAGLEFPQPRAVCVRGLVQHAQHERGQVFSDRDFDLGDTSPDLELTDQHAQFRDQAARRRSEYLAALQVGDQRARPLAKADEHPPLPVHELASKARPPAV